MSNIESRNNSNSTSQLSEGQLPSGKNSQFFRIHNDRRLLENNCRRRTNAAIFGNKGETKTMNYHMFPFFVSKQSKQNKFERTLQELVFYLEKICKRKQSFCINFCHFATSNSTQAWPTPKQYQYSGSSSFSRGCNNHGRKMRGCSSSQH